MSLGIVVILVIWACLLVQAIRLPWVGIVGYAGWAVLCPPWNWRWGLPDADYQKYLAGATLLGWFVSGFQRQRLTRAGALSLYLFVGYLSLSYISSLQSINPPKSAQYIDITWKIVLMSSLAAWLLSKPDQIVAFCWVLVLCQGWNAVNINQLYYQYGINVNYFTWNFIDNNTYSISTVPVMGMSIAIMFTTSRQFLRVVAGLVFVLQAHQLMILQSRGTMIGAMLLGATGIAFMPRTRTNLKWLGAAVVATAVLAGPSVVEEFSSSFQSSNSLDSSAQSRFKLWKAGYEILRDYPLLGVGPWAGERLVPQYYEGGLPGVEAKGLHNLVFEVGTGSGVPALCCYLVAFVLPWWRHFTLWLSDRHSMPEWMRMANLATLCGIPGYWMASMFSSGALIESPYLMLVMAISSLAVYHGIRERRNEELVFLGDHDYEYPLESVSLETLGSEAS